MTTRLEQIKARFTKQINPSTRVIDLDIADLLRIAEAAERWEESGAKLDAAERAVPPGIGKVSEDILHNYRTALDEYGRTKGYLYAAVRAFREGGGEG